MKIYQLTQVGAKIAKNTNAPDNSNWRVIYALDKLGYATSDQLVIQTGLSEEEISGALIILRRKGIVAER